MGTAYHTDMVVTDVVKAPNQMPPAVMTERQEKVAALRLHGLSTRAIGKELGVSHVTILKDLKVIREIWQQRMAQSYEEHVAERLARIDQLTEALRDGVERGDWKYIDQAIKLEDRAAKLLGVDAPVEHRVNITIDAIDQEIARLEEKARQSEIIDVEVIAEVVESEA